jgi:hypothetical protein
MKTFQEFLAEATTQNFYKLESGKTISIKGSVNGVATTLKNASLFPGGGDGPRYLALLPSNVLVAGYEEVRDRVTGKTNSKNGIRASRSHCDSKVVAVLEKNAQKITELGVPSDILAEMKRLMF